MKAVVPVASCRPWNPRPVPDLGLVVESGGAGLPASADPGAGRDSPVGGGVGSAGASAGFVATEALPCALADFGVGVSTRVTGDDPVAPGCPLAPPDEGGAGVTAVDEGADEVGVGAGGAGAGSGALVDGGGAVAAAPPAAGACGSPAGALGASSRVARKPPSPRTTTSTAAMP